MPGMLQFGRNEKLNSGQKTVERLRLAYTLAS
jgi:hypothetical protein